MNPLPIPIPTPKAMLLLGARGARHDQVRRALLASIDGHRNVIELESLARAMGLDSDALEHLRREGLIDLPE